MSYSPATETVTDAGQSAHAGGPTRGGQDHTRTPPFRPVQFLGAKTRVLQQIVDASLEHVGDSGRVLDVFTGSSLVAQSLARANMQVSATDALNHTVHFARALLGVGRDASSRPTIKLPIQVTQESWEHAWSRWVRREDAALADCDADALIRLAEITPQRWRPANASPPLRELLEYSSGERLPPRGLITAHYAGTYFGVIQAIAIDRIRAAIARARVSGAIDTWTESVLLTALLSAASECVFSAGKHYAQPHRIRPGKDLSFIRSRILADRSKDMMSLFYDRVIRICDAAEAAGVGHRAAHLTLEQLHRDPDHLGPIDAIYADPPYTAQQYSRFYHVPEVICSYELPLLQRVRGQLTRGLYPDNRFKSRFCSRRLAGGAFQELFSLAKHHNATLLLSYSASRSGKTGNRRSIELSELRALMQASFGRDVEERELPITFRQFNAANASVAGRADAELLFVARHHA